MINLSVMKIRLGFRGVLSLNNIFWLRKVRWMICGGSNKGSRIWREQYGSNWRSMEGGELSADRPFRIGSISKVDLSTVDRRYEPDGYPFGRWGYGSLNLAAGCRSRIPRMCRRWVGIVAFAALVDTRRFRWWRGKVKAGGLY